MPAATVREPHMPWQSPAAPRVREGPCARVSVACRVLIRARGGDAYSQESSEDDMVLEGTEAARDASDAAWKAGVRVGEGEASEVWEPSAMGDEGEEDDCGVSSVSEAYASSAICAEVDEAVGVGERREEEMQEGDMREEQMREEQMREEERREQEGAEAQG